eukprot:1161070-Pelagomonas_calceolata.AAC.8
MGLNEVPHVRAYAGVWACLQLPLWGLSLGYAHSIYVPPAIKTAPTLPHQWGSMKSHMRVRSSLAAKPWGAVCLSRVVAGPLLAEGFPVKLRETGRGASKLVRCLASGAAGRCTTPVCGRWGGECV